MHQHFQPHIFLNLGILFLFCLLLIWMWKWIIMLKTPYICITVLFVILQRYHGSETFNIIDIKSRLRYFSILIIIVLIVCSLVFWCEGCLYLAVINTVSHIVLTPSEPNGFIFLSPPLELDYTTYITNYSSNFCWQKAWF